MADVKLGINQGDHIYYYDLSLGGVSRQWAFSGGTPSTSTVYGPDIRYYGVNSDGYDTRLVVADAGGITAEAYKPNIIVVYPEIFNPRIEVTSGLEVIVDSPMGKTLTYAVQGTVSSGIEQYVWTIPQLGYGYTSPTVDFACTDWYALTGTYLGSPNSSYIVNAVADVTSVVGNGVTLNYGINFKKIGVQESINYWSPGTYATSGLYYENSMNFRTSVIGLGGNSLVIKIDFNTFSPKWNNTSFHSDKEVIYLWPNSPDISKTYSPIKANIILSPLALLTMGATGGYISQPRIMQGNYIIPGDITGIFASKFYMTDLTSGGTFTGLMDGNRKWSDSAISDFIENKYYLSGSSKFIELGGFYQFTANGVLVSLPYADLGSGRAYIYEQGGYAWDGGWPNVDGPPWPPEWFHGVSIPSSRLVTDLYGYDVDIDIRLKIRDSAGSIIDDFEFIISPINGEGNSPDLYMIIAGDTSYGSIDGLAYLINNGIASRGGGLSNNIIFENNPDLSPYTESYTEIYNGYSYFGALKMSIIDPKTSSAYSNSYIHSLEITWGTQMTNFIIYSINNELDFPSWPFACVLDAPSTSWTGLPNKISVPTSSYTNYFRGWKIGGALS